MLSSLHACDCEQHRSHPTKYLTVLLIAQMMHLGLDLQGRRHKLPVPDEFVAAAHRIAEAAHTVCPTLVPIRSDVGVVNWCLCYTDACTQTYRLFRDVYLLSH